MNPIEKGLAAALLAAMASFGFANCVEIKGSEYKVVCGGERDDYF